ncbi:tyrosine kinase receptor Cad96Ca isoform X1 [Bombyx mori]|uniref:receptor protein-tyrosine kinase n=1 Tax=Bombyx mori TaxID=7091 RepID=A0A8R2LXX2_BOMMO|nr:tyrosine kinase receptor Cad96Ca isoform X1 [Bombyx mori]XP_037868700.1 tyrosine kinase receptor Cad96Ca isoform X1 [Bombyx mori]
MSMGVWLTVAGCLVLTSSQQPPGFHLPAIMHVERNWFVPSNTLKGTPITRVYSDKTGTEAVTYGLEADGASVPFEINPQTGVVTVNDTLIDKENRSYSLWVTAMDGSIPQRTGVFAIITDNSGVRPKIPQPPISSLPFPPYANVPLQPKIPFTTIRTTKLRTTTTESYEDLRFPEATTLLPVNEEQNPVTDNRISVEQANGTSGDTKPASDTEKSLTIIPLASVGCFLVVVAGVILFIWKKNSARNSEKKDKDDMSKDSGGIVLQDTPFNAWERPRANSNRYECWDANHLQMSEETTITKDDYDEWEFPRHRLRIFNIVGEGAFGQVWRAQAVDIDGKKGEQIVAVKTLKENASEKEKTDLLQELIVMKNLGPHPNVVRLIGCCTEKEPTLVIMEFVSLGKLQQFLRDSRAERHYGNTHGGSQFLTSRDLTHFAFQVARGMDFLSSKGIIHRDLAARNVLITEERTCKVADFGFARDVGGSHVYERKSDGRLPIRWMAPESLYDDIFSVKSDIWSFGVLLWEIVTLGSTPYPGLSAGDVMRKVRDGHRLEKPEHCRRELYNIMYYCWEAEPSARPDFKEIVAMLEKLLCTEMDYIELERFPDHSYYNVQNLDGEKL